MTSPHVYGKLQCVCHIRIECTDEDRPRGNDDERLALSERTGKPDGRIHPRLRRSVEIDRVVYSTDDRSSTCAVEVQGRHTRNNCRWVVASVPGRYSLSPHKSESR